MVWWTYLVLPAALQYLFVAVVGVVLGSFATMLAHRIPAMMLQGLYAQPGNDAPGGREVVDIWQDCRCPSCDAKIKARHNVPLFGYLMLRGRCAHCKRPIAIRYLLLELISMICAAVLYSKYGPSAQFAAAFFFSWTLLLLAAIDAEHMLLPDVLTLPLLWIGLLCSTAHLYVDATSAIIGAAVGYLLLRVIGAAHEMVTGFGIGGGDMKMFAALCAWFGWQALPQLLLIAGLLSVLVSALKGMMGRSGIGEPKAFGPWLATAGIATMYLGDMLPMFYR